MIKNLKKYSKTSNGITLIALVITIIVILILAGISISMLSGDNGILQKATTAKENTTNSQITEKIQLAYHAALTGGQGSYTKDTLMDELKKEFETDYDVDDSDNKNWKMKAQGQEVIIPAGKKDNSKVSIKIKGTNESLKTEQNLSTYYGETTDYKSASSGDLANIDWQLFYSDTNNIYLIASDYVPNSLLSSELIKSTSTTNQHATYCAYFTMYSLSVYSGTIVESMPWSSGVESNTITENALTNTYLKWVNSTVATTKNNPNMKAVAYMMDTSKWDSFKGDAGSYAIGGPTVEMFALSYNAKHDTKLGTYGTTASDITSTKANSYGYKVKMGTGGWTNYVDGLDTTSDNMWVKKSFDKAYAYWLASPSSNFDNSVLSIYYSQLYHNHRTFNTNCGFRPVVSIPKSSLN